MITISGNQTKRELYHFLLEFREYSRNHFRDRYYYWTWRSCYCYQIQLKTCFMSYVLKVHMLFITWQYVSTMLGQNFSDKPSGAFQTYQDWEIL